MYLLRKPPSLFAVLVAVLLVGCGGGGAGGPGTAVAAPQTALLWITALEDATVGHYPRSFRYPETYIADGDGPSLHAAASGFGYESAFVRFALPRLPSGATIEEAHFQLFTPDDLSGVVSGATELPVLLADRMWEAMSISSGNRPNRVSGRPLPAFQLRLNAYDWSRSGDIRAIVADQFADPMRNYGFVVDLQYTGIAASVHFSSLNDDHAPSMHGASGPGRDMSGAPRLLVKVRLPAGTSAADIQAPPFANAGDPLGAPMPFRMIVDTGADWPADWYVR